MIETRRFAIFAAKRSGSNMLCTLLDAHPRITCHHELFNPRGVFVALRWRGLASSAVDLRARDDDPLGHLARVWAGSWPPVPAALASEPPVLARGFKLTRGQAAVIEAALLDDPTVAKIVLRRANLLATLVSEKIAVALDEWEVYDADELATVRPRVRVEAEELRAHVDAVAHWYAALERRMSASGQRWLELDYETLEHHAAQRRVLGYLGVGPCERAIVPRSVRQNPAPLAERISNYDELAASLRGDPLAAWLEPRP